MKPWTMKVHKWPRTVMLGVVFHWYDGRHKNIRGFDVMLHILFRSIQISYRNVRESPIV